MKTYTENNIKVFSIKEDKSFATSPKAKLLQAEMDKLQSEFDKLKERESDDWERSRENLMRDVKAGKAKFDEANEKYDAAFKSHITKRDALKNQHLPKINSIRQQIWDINEKEGK